LYKISIYRKKLWREQNTDKETLCMGIGITIMEAAAVDENSLSGL